MRSPLGQHGLAVRVRHDRIESPGCAWHVAGGDSADAVRTPVAKVSGLKYVTDAFREEAFEIINS